MDRREQERETTVRLTLTGQRKAVGCFIREGICEVEINGFEITIQYPTDKHMQASETAQHAYAEWAGLEPSEVQV